MVDQVKFFKVTTLPAELQPDALYFVQNDNYAESYLTDQNGVAKSVGNSVMINALIAEAVPPTQVNADWTATSGVAEILHKPTLALVATSGAYNDLTGTPTIPAAQVPSDWNASSGVARILNKPTTLSAFTNDTNFITVAAIPTDLSAFTNDAGFITVASVPTHLSQLSNDVGYITISSVPTKVSQLTNDSGFLTAITSGQVTGALGYTPYNATNPNGYISGITSLQVTTALGFTPYNATNPSGYISANQNIAISGDGSGSGITAITFTLATVNANIGTFNNVTVNAKGLVTSASNVAYLTSITSGQVTTALGYTPYNATNPSNYISANQSIAVTGDVTGSGTTAITLTLANVNANVGTFNNVTVNAKGLVTAASNVSYLTTNQSITLSGGATGSGSTAITVTLTNASVTGQALTGYTSGAGTISATDTILTAINKLNGNIGALVTGVSSVTNADSTLVISPTTGTVVASLNLAHANTWTAAQIINVASIGIVQTPGLTLTNTTAASAGTTVQESPKLLFSGQGWMSSGAGASQNVQYRFGVLPTTALSVVSGSLIIESSINGAAFVQGYSFQPTSNGQYTFNSIGMTINAISSGGISLCSTAVANNKLITSVGFTIQAQNATTGGTFGQQFNNTITAAVTSGNVDGTQFTFAFNPTSGTATMNVANINPTINQTGGASGITRGLYINPTLTAAAAWRAIEIVAGKIISAAGTATTASLNIPTGVAPTTPVEGDIWKTSAHLFIFLNGATVQIV